MRGVALPSVVTGSLLIVGTALLTGCPAQHDEASTALSATARQSTTLAGTVFGGRQAIVNAVVTAYATATSRGAAPVQIGADTTDANGSFEMTFAPAPVTGQIVYLTAFGGDAWAGTNPEIGLLTVAGVYCTPAATNDVRCRFPDSVNINELATVAAAATLKHDLKFDDCATIGGNTRSGQCAVLMAAPGLEDRVRAIASLVNASNGQVSTFLAAQMATSSNPVYVTLQKLEALANMIVACVNSNAGPVCDTLFSEALGRSANTLEAALDIAAWPGVNAKGKVLYGLMPTNPVFQASAVLADPPDNWTIAGDRFVYVVNTHSGKLSVWRQSPLTGALAPLVESGACSTPAYPVTPDPMNCFDVGAAPSDVALDPLGRFLWVADDSNQTITTYGRDPATGTLIDTGETVSLAGDVGALAVSSTGERLYVGLKGVNEVVAYAVGANGGLSAIDAAPVGTQPTALAITPSGHYLYAASENSTQLLTFSMAVDGRLTQIGTAPIGLNARALAISPSGGNVYAAIPSLSRIVTYTVQANGTLAKLGATNVSGAPAILDVDASGRFLYAIDSPGNTATGYSILPGGGIDTAPVATVSTGANPSGIGAVGEFVYVTNKGGNSVSAWHVRQTASPSGTAAGALSAIHVVTPAPAGSFTDAVAVDPTGRYVYAVNSGCHGGDHPCPGTTGSVSAWRLDAVTGGLVPLAAGPFEAGVSAELIAIDPSGRSVYVANRGEATGNSSVSAWRLNSATGVLTDIASYSLPVGTGPYSIAVAPDGEHVYTANYDGSSISIFTRHGDGSLAFLQTAPVSGTGALSVAITSNGHYLYTANHASDNLSAYHLNAATGLPDWEVTGSPFPASASTDWVAVDPVEPYLYAVNFGADNVTGYKINASGALTPVPGSPFTVGAGKRPRAIAVDPFGRYLYVSNHTGNDVSAWRILSNGSLQAVAGSPFPAGNEPLAITVDPSGSYVFTANHSGNDVSAFVILSGGVLAPVAASAPFAAGAGPAAIAISP